MRRTEVTYGQLGRVLQSFGFTCRIVDIDGDARVYEHKQSEAMIILPAYPESDRVLEHHLLTVRGTLDGFGVADPTEFVAKLKKAA